MTNFYLLVILFYCHIVDTSFINRYISDRQTLHKMWHLATTERYLIHTLLEVEDRSDELDYYVEFLVEDSGYNQFLEPVETILEYPLDRFKVVERFVWDWPQIGEAEGVNIDIMGEFGHHSTLLTADDLVETVRELNEILSTYYRLHDDGASSLSDAMTSLTSPGVSLNPGNLLILTNISHALGHVSACVIWGDAADTHLVTSEEPFTIPGEKYWLEFYLEYLECLMELGGKEEKVGVVAEEIKGHYRSDAGVKRQIERIMKGKGPLKMGGEELGWCSSRDVRYNTRCFYEKTVGGYYNLARAEKVIGTDIMFYTGLVPGVNTMTCPSDTTGKVVIDNSEGYYPVRVVTRQAGTLVLEAGWTVKMSSSDVIHLCSSQRGYVKLFGMKH